MEHQSSGQCPLVQDPLDECYCLNVSSLTAEETIYYCGENFEECAIYQGYLEKGGGLDQ